MNPCQVGAELLRGREVDGVHGSELDGQYRAGGVQDAITQPPGRVPRDSQQVSSSGIDIEMIND